MCKMALETNASRSRGQWLKIRLGVDDGIQTVGEPFIVCIEALKLFEMFELLRDVRDVEGNLLVIN